MTLQLLWDVVSYIPLCGARVKEHGRHEIRQYTTVHEWVKDIPNPYCIVYATSDACAP